MDVRTKLVPALRLCVVAPVVLLPTLLLLQRIADHSHLPLGIICLIAWAAIVLLWLFAELLVTRAFRFSLAGLLLAVPLFAVILGYGRAWVYVPYMRERQALELLPGARVLSTTIDGPLFLQRLLGENYFKRVDQLSIGPECGNKDIPTLLGLSHLSFIWFEGPGFTDDGLILLSELPPSASVTFNNTQVTLAALQKASTLHPKMKVAIQSPTQVYAEIMNGRRAL
jgi:hypothetical protein